MSALGGNVKDAMPYSHTDLHMHFIPTQKNVCIMVAAC